MPALYLTEADVERLLDMKTGDRGLRGSVSPPGRRRGRERSRAPRAGAGHRAALDERRRGVSGARRLEVLYDHAREGADFIVGLYDQSGALVALIEADRLGQLRTGATTGVAVAGDGRSRGHRGRTVRHRLASAKPVGRRGRRAADQGGLRLQPQRAEAQRLRRARCRRGWTSTSAPVDRPQEAAEDLPIVVTATTSREPVFDGNWLAEGTLVCAVGSNWLNKAEIDSTVIRRADNIVCDSVKACQNEAGDFVDAIEKGIFDWSRAVDLADVVTGRATGRNTRESIALFKSVGLAIEDVALGGKLLELAREQGIGSELPI